MSILAVLAVVLLAQAAPAGAGDQAGNAGAETAAPAPPPPAWTGTVGLGLIALTGNSQTITFKANGAFQRKSENWIWGATASAVYGRTTDATTDVSTTNALGGSFALRGDRRLTPKLSSYLIAGFDTDHVKSIEGRPYGEIGASLTWWEEMFPLEGPPGTKPPVVKSSLRTDLGFRYGRELRFQYYPTPAQVPDVDIVAPHLGLSLRYAISKEIIFTQDADVTPNLVGDARLLVVTLTKLAARLTESVNLGIGFAINYDGLPPAPKKTTDTALTVGLEVAL